jgi:hypothetical protein
MVKLSAIVKPPWRLIDAFGIPTFQIADKLLVRDLRDPVKMMIDPVESKKPVSPDSYHFAHYE